MRTRRTIRQYSDRNVPAELLNELLTVAMQASNTGNMQLYSVVVTQDAEQKKRLAPAHFNQPMVTEAPVVLTICADFHRTSVWARQRKAVPGYNNFLSFVNGAIDALLYTQTLCNLMDEEGLGYCYIGTTVYMPQMIIDTLNLPQQVVPLATLTVGWPAEKPQQTDRLPLDSFVHRETYHDYTADDINRYYQLKESLEENQNFCKINNKETLAQIFTDIRYTKKDNEAMSAGLMEVLRKQGFME